MYSPLCFFYPHGTHCASSSYASSMRAAAKANEDSGAILCRGVEVQHSTAGTRSHRASAIIASVERRLTSAQCSHDRRRQVVLTVDTSRVAARHDEQRRRAVHDDASDVPGPSHSKPLLDVQLQADELGHLLAKRGRFVLPPTSLGKSLGGQAVSSQRRHHDAST